MPQSPTMVNGCHTPQYPLSTLFPSCILPHSDNTMTEIMTPFAGVKKLVCRVCQKGFTKAEHLRVSVHVPMIMWYRVYRNSSTNLLT